MLTCTVVASSSSSDDDATVPCHLASTHCKTFIIDRETERQRKRERERERRAVHLFVCLSVASVVMLARCFSVTLGAPWRTSPEVRAALYDVARSQTELAPVIVARATNGSDMRYIHQRKSTNIRKLL